MENGKKICSQLKEIRKEIARENNIPLESRECTYQGPCNGTCPHCEAELKYLEEELTRRSHLGKAAVVAGMTIGMVTAAQNVSAQNNHEREPLMGDVVAEIRIDTANVTGFVLDEERGTLLSDVELTFARRGDTVITAVTHTNKEGKFEVALPYGSYLVGLSCRDYLYKTEDVIIDNKEMLLRPMTLYRREEMLMGIIPVIREEPIPEEGTPAEETPSEEQH